MRGCEDCKDATCEVTGTVMDYLTGKRVPDTLPEKTRQKMERYLVEEKGYSKEDIEIGASFEVEVDGQRLAPRVDLVVGKKGKRVMVIKCVYGTLAAGERLIISYGRLLDDYQIPYAAITNWEDTTVMDTRTGKAIGYGLGSIPAKGDLDMDDIEFVKYPEDRIEKEKRILSAYENINEDLCSAF